MWLLQTDLMSLRRFATTLLEGPMKENLTVQNKYVMTSLRLMEDAMASWTWEWIVQEVQNIQSLAVKFRSNIKPGTPLPTIYSRSLASLETLLSNLIKRSASWFFMKMALRPGFRSKWDTGCMQRLQTMAWTLPKRNDGLFVETSLWGKDTLEFCLLSFIKNTVRSIGR